MRFTLVATAALAQVMAVSAAQTWTIMVGMNDTNTFTPTSVNASVGDTIAFQFVSKNHTATQSTFAAPCQNMTTPTQGIDSGFMPVAANSTMVPEWSFTMNNASAPLWFYCRQTGHCQQGMVFAVNPTPQKSFAMFQQAAMSSGNSSSGASASVTPSASGSTTSPSAKSNANGAMRLGGSAAGMLTLVGLVAGLVL